MLESHKTEMSHDVSNSLSVAYIRKFDLQHNKYGGILFRCAGRIIHCVLISGT